MFLASLPLNVWLPVLAVGVMPFELGVIIFLIFRLSGWANWARRFPAGPMEREGPVIPGAARGWERSVRVTANCSP